MKDKIVRSSYLINNFEIHFKDICLEYNPKSVLEIGLLDGYSLEAFAKNLPYSSKILGIDIFESYEFKNAEYKYLVEKFEEFKNVKIEYGDFYDYFLLGYTFDLIHIDISNDADIFEFAIKNYLPLCNKALVLEGGTKERDEVGWMVKHNKKPISNYLNTLNTNLNFKVIKDFPSMTIIKK